MGYTSKYAQDQMNKAVSGGHATVLKSGEDRPAKRKAKVSGLKRKYNYDSDKGAKESLSRLKKKK